MPLLRKHTGSCSCRVKGLMCLGRECKHYYDCCASNRKERTLNYPLRYSYFQVHILIKFCPSSVIWLIFCISFSRLKYPDVYSNFEDVAMNVFLNGITSSACIHSGKQIVLHVVRKDYAVCQMP